MSAMSQKARDDAKSKVERLVRSGKTRVDASDFSAQDAMDANSQTGMQPVSRRNYRRGGKVAGEKSPPRADRKPRSTGGAAPLTPNNFINRDAKEANMKRDGIHLRGGLKTGGRATKAGGGLALPAWNAPVARREGGKVHADEKQDRELIHKMGCACKKCGGGRVGKKAGGAINDGTRPVAGRLARKGGGRTKKGTNVNIIIAPQGGGQKPPMPPMGMAPPPGGPVGLHQGAPPPAPMGPPAGAGAPPPGVPPPMMRKTGGRTLEKDGGKLVKPGVYPIESGAGGGLGRLEKAKAARP